MKKSIRRKRWLCLALAVILALMLTGCGSKLNGTYSSTGFIAQTVTFDGDKIVLTAFGLNISGTYEIHDDTITVYYTLLGSELSMDFSFEKDGKTILIEGTEFVKQ